MSRIVQVNEGVFALEVKKETGKCLECGEVTTVGELGEDGKKICMPCATKDPKAFEVRMKGVIEGHLREKGIIPPLVMN